MEINWELFWASVLSVAIVAGLVLGIGALTSEHKVDGYYLSRGGGDRYGLTCVYAHWTWHTDEVAMCTDDPQHALDFATKATALLGQR